MPALTAVILAAGSGIGRKALAEVGGTSALLWTLAALRDAGVMDATVVLGHDGDMIRSTVQRTVDRPRVDFVLSEAWERTDSAYSFGLGAVRPGPVLVTYANVFLRPSLLRRVLAAGDTDVAAVDRSRPSGPRGLPAHVTGGRVRRIRPQLPALFRTGESACLFRLRERTARVLAAAGRQSLPAGRMRFETLLDGMLDQVRLDPVWCEADEWCVLNAAPDVPRAERLLAAERARPAAPPALPLLPRAAAPRPAQRGPAPRGPAQRPHQQPRPPQRRPSTVDCQHSG
jgi:choline kinase